MESNNKVKTNKVFKLVFSATLAITVSCGGTSLWLASQEKLTEPQQRIIETCIATWQTGCGVIFGLLGSKATDLFDTNG